MALTGLAFLLLLLMLAAILAAGTGLLWNRWQGLHALPVRAGGLLLIMVSGAVIAFDAVNRQYSFYTSFTELTGGQSTSAGAASAGDPALPAAVLARGRRAAVRGHGIILPWQLAGPRSGISRRGLLYLPAAYFDRGRPALRFAVVELFHGNPGGPPNWVVQMHLAATLDSEIGAGRVPPLIAVMPLYTRAAGRECLNTPASQDETYLAADVPADIGATFRIRTRPGSWATMGYSQGAFCAVNLALHHPDRYGAAVSLSGYYSARADRLVGASSIDSPLEWLAGRHAGLPAVYLMGSAGDRRAVSGLAEFRRAAGRRLALVTVSQPSGGHNFRVWSQASVPAFDWLASRLPGPLAAPVSDPAATIIGDHPQP